MLIGSICNFTPHPFAIYESLIIAVVIKLRLKHLLILKHKYQVMQNYFFYTIRLVDIGNEACIRRHFNFNFFAIQIVVK